MHIESHTRVMKRITYEYKPKTQKEGDFLIQSEWDGDRLTVYLDGEIDHFASVHLREDIEAELKRRPVSQLVLDFSDVRFMDSSGVGMIIGRYKTMKAHGGSVYAQGLHPPIDRLFHLAGLHRIIAIKSGGQETYE